MNTKTDNMLRLANIETLILGLVALSFVGADRIDRASLFGSKEIDKSTSQPTYKEFAALAEALERKLQSSNIEDDDIIGVEDAARGLLEHGAHQEGGRSNKGSMLLQKLANLRPGTTATEVAECAVDLFARLSSEMWHCNHESFALIKDNFKLAIGEQDYLEPTRRLNRAILFAMQKNGEICRPNFMRLYLGAAKSFKDSPMMADVNKILDNELLDQELFAGTDLRARIRMSRSEIGERLLAKLRPIFGRILSRAQEEPDEFAKFATIEPASRLVRITDRDHLRYHSVQEYLVVPCSEFVMNYARIFSRARFSLALDDSKVGEIVKGSREFGETWTKYRICESIWLEGDKFSKAIAELS